MSDIGLARRQKVFAVVEDVKGTLKFPAASDYVLPAGNAVINQTPSFSDSEELIDSLDIIDQFQNATPPGDFSVPMYVRPSGVLGTIPQGNRLLVSLQGLVYNATAATLNGAITKAGATVKVDGIKSGLLPRVGVIQIGTELIRYTGKIASTSTAATLTGCTRGHNSTTATNHSDDVAVTMKCVFYKQSTTSPSFSLWVETDHFVQGLSGCAVNDGVLSLTNEGGLHFDMSGQGMRMVWAGKDELTAEANSAATLLSVVSAKRFSVNGRVYNYTALDSNGATGYNITRVDTTLNKIAVTPGISATWASGDVVRGFLPTGTKVGSVIEGKDAVVHFSGVSAKFRSTQINFNTPKAFITDEVGTAYPEDYIEDVRSISSDNFSLYFRKESAKYFAEGYAGNEIPISLFFGDTVGYKMTVVFPRTKLQVPKVEFSSPAVLLTIPMKALGTLGEDSCEIIFE